MRHVESAEHVEAVSVDVSERQDSTGRVSVVERHSGAGKLLIMVYIILALASTGRSTYQLITKFDEAPAAYLLSALAGIVYIVAAIALIKRRGAWRAVAWTALTFELVGVLVVGTLSLTTPQWFAHPSVWSWFGAGYLWIPLVLPAVGLLWLYRGGRGGSTRGGQHAPQAARRTGAGGRTR